MLVSFIIFGLFYHIFSLVTDSQTGSIRDFRVWMSVFLVIVLSVVTYSGSIA